MRPFPTMNLSSRFGTIFASTRPKRSLTVLLDLGEVTLEASDRIAALFFKPDQRFRFGLGSFLECSLCNLDDAKTMSGVIDVFYCLVGYVDSCHLEEEYVALAPNFVDFIDRLLLGFLKGRGFDARRFVWMIEKLKELAHLSPAAFRAACERALKLYVSGTTVVTGLARLQGILIISTSPSLHELPTLGGAVGTVFRQTLREQRDFTHRYVFGSFGTLVWTGDDHEQTADRVSCQIRAWRICLDNLVARVKARPELPQSIVVAFLDDSLAFLKPYYGEVQASRQFAIRLRMDAIAILSAFEASYPGEIPPETKQALWFLLFVVAISGASKEELSDVSPEGGLRDEEVFLGLERTDRDLLDYRTALRRLRPKFESEFEEVFGSLVAFLRYNYNETQRDS
jgi:hypothetical protein